jgi:hypothetical protein
VVVGDLIGSGASQEQAIVGETPNLAARLQGAAEPNSVVIAESTRKLVGNLFELQDLGGQDLKGEALSISQPRRRRPRPPRTSPRRLFADAQASQGGSKPGQHCGLPAPRCVATTVHADQRRPLRRVFRRRGESFDANSVDVILIVIDTGHSRNGVDAARRPGDDDDFSLRCHVRSFSWLRVYASQLSESEFGEAALIRRARAR